MDDVSWILPVLIIVGAIILWVGIKGIIKDKELLGTVGPIIVGAVFWYIAFSGIVGD